MTSSPSSLPASPSPPPQALFSATRIFASNMDVKRAQRFYNTILLPAVRDDIYANRKLNYHLFMALKKALFKPAAFYKGIVLPLCKACNLREATILSAVLARVSIPMMHSAAAIMKIATMPCVGVARAAGAAWRATERRAGAAA